MVTSVFVSSAGKILTLGEQHVVAACEELEQDRLQKHLKPKPWMVRFTQTRLPPDTQTHVVDLVKIALVKANIFAATPPGPPLY